MAGQVKAADGVNRSVGYSLGSLLGELAQDQRWLCVKISVPGTARIGLIRGQSFSTLPWFLRPPSDNTLPARIRKNP